MKTIKILRKAGKWTGIILLGLIVLILIIWSYSSLQTKKRLNTIYVTDDINIEIPNDSVSIAHGNRLVSIHGCRDCHGQNLSGKTMIDNFMLGKLTTANLTGGKGGRPSGYSDQDWLRALKHGLNIERKSLIIMPSNESTRIPDQDLADIVAYCKSLPPVDNEGKKLKIGPLMLILNGIGQINLITAEQIDHNIDYIVKPKEEVSAEFGATLAINCTACHRENFQGGPSLAPGHPPVPNISSTGRPGKWNEEQFIQTLRTGIRPDGQPLDNEIMPWQRFSDFSDVELKALRTYLMSFPKDQPISMQQK